MSDAFPCLLVTYDKTKGDHKERLAEAYERYGYRPGQCTMLVVPADSKTLKMARTVKPLNIEKEMEN